MFTMLYWDFNLVLPDLGCFIEEISYFNNTLKKEKLLFGPEIIIDEFDDEAILFVEYFDSTLGLPIKIEISGTVNPVTSYFEVSSDFCDDSPDRLGLRYLEYLCERYKGTMVGVCAHCGGLEPIKIIQGRVLPCKLALVEEEGNVSVVHKFEDSSL